MVRFKNTKGELHEIIWTAIIACVLPILIPLILLIVAQIVLGITNQ